MMSPETCRALAAPRLEALRLGALCLALSLLGALAIVGAGLGYLEARARLAPPALVLAPRERAPRLEAPRYVRAEALAPHYVIAWYGDGCQLERDRDLAIRMYCPPYVAVEEWHVPELAPAPAPYL